MNMLFDEQEANASPLIEIENKSAYDVFTGGTDAIAPILSKVRAIIDGFVGDASTEEGRRHIKAFTRRIVRSKTYLDGIGKDLTTVAKEIPKKIDANRKIARDTLDAWADEVRAPVTAWEEQEKARQDAIKARLEDLKALIADVSERTVAQLEEALSRVLAIELTAEQFEEYLDAAAELRDAAAARLNERLPAQRKREEEQAELAAFRAEKAKVEQAEREDMLRQEGIKAAEAAAAAKKAKEAEDEAKRKADEEHVRNVNRAARDALVVAGVDAKVAQKVIELIARNKVPRVSISY